MLTLAKGTEYCFSVRARDRVGNVSGWTADQCTTAPLDDRALTRAGAWTSLASAGYYTKTSSKTTALKASLSRTGVQAKRVYVVVTKTRGAGTADVFLGTRKVGTVNLSAAGTQLKQVVALPALPSVLSGTLSIRVTSSGKPVEVDGVAFRRT